MISFAMVYAGAAFAPNITVTGVFGRFPALISNVIGGSMCFITMLATVMPELKRMKNNRI